MVYIDICKILYIKCAWSHSSVKLTFFTICLQQWSLYICSEIIENINKRNQKHLKQTNILADWCYESSNRSYFNKWIMLNTTLGCMHTTISNAAKVAKSLALWPWTVGETYCFPTQNRQIYCLKGWRHNRRLTCGWSILLSYRRVLLTLSNKCQAMFTLLPLYINHRWLYG